MAPDSVRSLGLALLAAGVFYFGLSSGSGADGKMD
jgi:hypothetical protein